MPKKPSGTASPLGGAQSVFLGAVVGAVGGTVGCFLGYQATSLTVSRFRILNRNWHILCRGFFCVSTATAKQFVNKGVYVFITGRQFLESSPKIGARLACRFPASAVK
jgi:hypothetical protein